MCRFASLCLIVLLDYGHGRSNRGRRAAARPGEKRLPPQTPASISSISRTARPFPPRSRSASGSRTWRSRRQESLSRIPVIITFSSTPRYRRSISRSRAISTTFILAAARPRRRSRCPQESTLCSSCWVIRLTFRTIRLSCPRSFTSGSMRRPSKKPERPRRLAPGVFLIEPADGATVGRNVKVKFGVSGMELAPAGTSKPNSGHHHL